MTTTPDSASVPESEQFNPQPETTAKAPTRRRSTRATVAPTAGTAPADQAGDSAAAESAEQGAAADAPAAEAPKAPRKRAPRKTAPKKTADDAAPAGTETADDTAAAGSTGGTAEAVSAADAAAEVPKRTARTTRSRTARAAATTAAAPAADAAESAADAPAGDTPAADAGAKKTPAKAKQPRARQGTRRAISDAGVPAASESGAPEASVKDDAPQTSAEDAASGTSAENAAPAATARIDDSPAPAEPESEPAAPAKSRRASTRSRSTKADAAPAETTQAPAGDAADTPAPAGEAAETTQAPAVGTDRATGGEQAADSETVSEQTAGEPAAQPPAARRGRRPARAPEQKIDVLAEFSAAEPAPAAADEAGVQDEEDPEEGAEESELRLPATALLFQAPDPTRGRRRVQAPSGPPPARTRDEAAQDPDESEDASSDEEASDERQPRSRRRSGRSSRSGKQQDAGTSDAPQTDSRSAQDAPADQDQTSDSDDDGDDSEGEGSSEATGGQRRRRRRGGRGRRNRGSRDNGDGDSDEESTDDTDEDTDASAEGATDSSGDAGEAGSDDSDGDNGDDDSETSSSRRRRRRRRSGSASRDDGTADSREGRAARDEITALKGSTRLEAKRQRRRDGRDAGRRRTTITEAEFLARREAVERSMVVRELDGRIQIAVLEDDVLVEHYVAQEKQSSMVGNVYLGRVQNVLPSMEAAFVDLGKGRNAVLYAGEVNWDAAGMKGQPRRIEQALSSGDSVLVQVTKDPIGHKGARLTSQVTLAGRYLVYVPSGAMTGISRKLPESERNRLKKLLKEIVPEGAGVIVRTAAEGATEEQLRADVERLTAQWEEIQAKSTSAKSAPVLLKGEPELAVRVVRDVFNEDFRSLIVSGDGAWQTISGYVRELSPDLADRMHHWTDTKDVFAAHRIDEQLAKGMDRKVYLPSGGSLVIDRTEAMTVIDVNTGKFTGSGGTLEETVTKNNLEAAEEVVRQLRLRDIGGIIVIDFIDMVLESNRDLVLRRLVECLGRDRTRHQVAEVTSLGLVQMTRKRVGQGLVEAFSEPCEHCSGRGYIVHDHPVERGSSGGGNGDGGGGRRRGRRGGNGTRQEEPAPPAPPAEDPQAAAAREAVKATLATIAAAAEKAHVDEPTDRPDTGDADATGDAAPAAAADDAAPAVVDDAAPAVVDDAAAPDASTDDAAPDASTDEAAEAATAGAAGSRQSSAKARQRAAERKARTVPSSLEELAAALPTGERRDGTTDGSPAGDAEAAPAASEQPAEDPQAAAGEQQPAAATSEPSTPASAEQPRKRRPRRVTSGGPITA